jgi:Amidohydrolase family
MKTNNLIKGGLGIMVLLALSMTAQASHRALLFNDMATEKILEMWPDFVESINNETRGMENPGERSLIVQTGLRAHINNLLREQPSPAQFAGGFKVLADEYYSKSGMTTFGSRLETADQITGFQHILREDGRLPVRFAWSAETATQPIPAAAASGLYATIGVQWQGMASNPWLWLRGISSEGGWDAPNRGCLGNDLPAKPGVDVRQVKEVLEICPDFTSPNVQALIRGLRAGWRFVGVHGVGSHGFRIFQQQLEEAMKLNPGVLTLDYVRNSRHGFAHGTMTGAVPDVVEGWKKYNIYVPINLRRALAVEPDNIRQNYGEPGWKFLGPVKTLLDQGVMVVAESEIGYPDEHTYFKQIDVFVNREISKGIEEGRQIPAKFGEGEVYVPEERIDRVVSLKLHTYRSAEFHFAEEQIGSLEVGKYADFAIIDKDFLSGPDTEIRDNKVLMTVLAGQTRYKDAAYNPVER